MSPALTPIIQSALIPSSAAAIVLALARWRRFRTETAFMLAAAFLAGDVAVRGIPKFPAPEVSLWLPWAAMGCLVLAGIESAAPRRHWLHGLIALCLLGGLVLLLTQPLLKYEWSGSAKLYQPFGIGLGMIGLGVSAAVALHRLPRPVGIAVVAIQCLGASVLLAATRSLLLGQLCGALVAGSAVALLGSFLGSPKEPHIAIGATLASLLGGLLFMGHYYSSTPTGPALGVALAPLAGFIINLPGIRRWGGTPKTVMSLFAVVLVVSAAIAWGFFETKSSASSYASY